MMIIPTPHFCTHLIQFNWVREKIDSSIKPIAGIHMAIFFPLSEKIDIFGHIYNTLMMHLKS